MSDPTLTQQQIDDIHANIADAQNRLSRAAESADRDPAKVQLLAITKTWPACYHQAAYNAGLRQLGESRQQEAMEKIDLLPKDLQWHFIGHLQRNKIRKTLPLFPIIHAIDSLKLATAIDRIADELDLRPEVYLQINLAQEASKYGFTTSSIKNEVQALLELPNLRIQGLMCIPPIVANPELSRPDFQKLRQLRNELQETTGTPLPGLSMGMSHDYEIAAQEGSTIVRIGSALFGPRPKK